MAKYVCDFEKVNSTIKKLNNYKDNISKSIKKYNEEIENITSGYQGTAKDIMIHKININIENMKRIIENINNIIIHIEKSSKIIYEAEEKLSSLKI